MQQTVEIVQQLEDKNIQTRGVSKVTHGYYFFCRFKTQGVNLKLLSSSVTENFLSGNLKFSVVFSKCNAYCRTEVQNRCMDGDASICG